MTASARSARSVRVTTAEVRADLDALAASDAPMPRATFVAELEARLAAMMEGAANGDLLPEAEIEVLPAPAPARRVPTVALSIAVVILLLTVGIAMIRPADGGHRTGVDLAGPPPGPGGGDGDDQQAGQPAAAAETDLSSRAAVAEEPVVPAVRSAPPRSGTTVGTAAAGADPHPAATSAPEASAEVRSASAPFGPTAAAPKSIALRGSGTPPRVVLDWDAYRSADFAAYLVLRSAAPNDPNENDATGQTTMLLRVENAEQTHHEDTGKVGTTPRYRIVAVDRSGRTIARSGVFQADSALGTTRSITQLPFGATS